MLSDRVESALDVAEPDSLSVAVLIFFPRGGMIFNGVNSILNFLLNLSSQPLEAWKFGSPLNSKALRVASFLLGGLPCSLWNTKHHSYND